ncbi:Bacterial trigger factor protein (TF) [Musa troglodytarum]|uniref:Bacterial trigger factor protein (TF) n=1 Tax=Musa troglodytarum TaxID=320322 RepID=A0A9E7EZS6_9LILI|nr:Bacterial trigger factor protein (TF) [Musa troglodytarum]URD84783.1 Bacterial trigger factor protein (TF) [Musa troglodytarum]
MALMMMTAVGPKLPLQRNKSRISRVMVPISLKATLSRTTERANACNVWEGQSLTFLHQRGLRHSPWSTFAVGPGLEASISDPSKNDIRLDNVKIVIESRDNDKITVPKSFLLQMLGRDRVTKFLIQEIVGITIGDYILPLTQEKEAVSEFASTRAAINTLRWFIWSYLPQYKSRLVFDDLPQQCADECVACSGRVDLFDGVGLDAAMEILDPRKPAKSA